MEELGEIEYSEDGNNGSNNSGSKGEDGSSTVYSPATALTQSKGGGMGSDTDGKVVLFADQ
jgi:hypothetical protein